MGLQKVERVRKFLVFEYDSAVDATTAGAVTMRNLSPLNGLEEGLIILDCFAEIITGATAAGTIDIGDGTTADKWFDTTVIAAAATGAVCAPQTTAKLSKLESGKVNPVLTIGVGGLTTFKIRAYFEYVKPL